MNQTLRGTVSAAPLQDFDIPTPIALIKIDVEGMAASVLEGARKIIEDQKPLIFCEAFDGEFGDVERIIGELGYKVLKSYGDGNYLFGHVR